jgi:hypothetical protein
MPMKALLLALLTGCSAPALGDPFWQTATLCTTPELAAVTQDAANRWHDADQRVSMTVRTGERGCGDADVYEVESVEDGPGMAGGTVPGDVQLMRGIADKPYGSDVVAHELGHLLIGGDGAHNPDKSSVMCAVPDYRAKEVLASDTAKVGSELE